MDVEAQLDGQGTWSRGLPRATTRQEWTTSHNGERSDRLSKVDSGSHQQQWPDSTRQRQTAPGSARQRQAAPVGSVESVSSDPVAGRVRQAELCQDMEAGRGLQGVRWGRDTLSSIPSVLAERGGTRGTRAAFRLVLNRRGKDVDGRQQRL